MLTVVRIGGVLCFSPSRNCSIWVPLLYCLWADIGIERLMPQDDITTPLARKQQAAR